MFRVCLLVLFVFVGSFFQGCGALEFFKGDSREESKETRAGKEEVTNEVARLNIENRDLKKEIDILKKENEEIRENNRTEIAKAEGKRAALNKELRNLREQNQKTTNNSKLPKEKLQKFEQKKNLRELKIKVLSGDGNLRSAKQMAKRLTGMGYKIRRIAYAPRSNFKKTSVYFSPKFENEGRRLVSSLGANTVLKPLTWSSIFDLVVVTAKNP